MIALYLILILPLFGALLMSIVGKKQCAGLINIAINAAGFVCAMFLTYYFFKHGAFLTLKQQIYIDAFNLLIIILTTFVATTTSVFSNTFIWQNAQIDRINSKHLRLYHVMYQLFIFMMLVVLVANNIGIIWIAMEGATLATVLLVSLYRTKEAIEASWKYFILCIIGIALALFGTILVYFAADEILWSNLIKIASKLDPAVIKIAFIFLLVGYGTKIGLAPLHNWLPDTYSQSPAPVSALLSGLLSTVSLYALIRFKIFAGLVLANNLPGNLMMIFGLLSFMVAAIMLQRQRDIKRLFAYSSIEHMGLITFIFGLGGAYVGLFYLLMHSLVKSAIFVIIGNIVQQTKTKILETIRGLITSDAKLGWTLIIATLAIAGMPPFGIFTSELMLFITCMQFNPWLVILLFSGFIFVIYGIWRNIQPIVFGAPSELIKAKTCLWPAWLHLLLAMVLGVYVPVVLRDLLQAAAKIIV